MDPVTAVAAAAGAKKAVKKIEKRKAGDKLQEKTPEASKAKEAVENKSKGLDNYISYLNDYDRTARGAGSSKGTDRLSAKDLDHVFKAGKDFGLSRQDRASEVLQYARRVEDKTKMGGASQRYLDNLREIVKKSSSSSPSPAPTPDSKPESKPKPKPTPEPESTKPEAPVTVTAPITVNGPVVPPKRTPSKTVNTTGGLSNQYVDQSRTLGSSFVGNVTGDGNSINLSNTDNSFNSVTGNDYRPDFMKFLRK